MASVKQCGIESLNSQVTSVRIYGDDTAVVLGAMQGTVKEGDFQFDLLYTRVYILQNGGWRLVAHQSTDAPQRGASEYHPESLLLGSTRYVAGGKTF